MLTFLQDNEISREQRRRQRTDKELRDVRSKLDIKTAEHEEVRHLRSGSMESRQEYGSAPTDLQGGNYDDIMSNKESRRVTVPGAKTEARGRGVV